MKHLGTYLLENGIVSADQLEDALQSQVAFGGRLGTNLVELGHLSLEELGQHLSAHSGLPLAPREWLETPELAALQALPVELVRRHKAIPLHIEGRTLHVAMIEPWNPAAVDEIAFATGMLVRPYVMPEATAYYWLDYHFDIPREIRHVDLSGQRPGQETPRPSGDPPPLRLTAEAEALGIAPPDGEEELVDETAFFELQTRLFRAQARAEGAEEGADAPGAPGGEAPSTGSGAASESSAAGPQEAAPPAEPVPQVEPPGADPAAAAPGHASGEGIHPREPGDEQASAGHPAAFGPAAFAEHERTLAEATDRDAVAAAAMGMAGHVVASAALFVVRPGAIEGLCGSNEEIGRRSRSILLSDSADTAFASPVHSGEPLRAPPPADGLDARVLGILGRTGVREMAVLPVAIRGRVVNLLYADNGEQPLGDVAFATLETLAQAIASAYERLILERKRRMT